jgi:hypothetical protein
MEHMVPIKEAKLVVEVVRQLRTEGGVCKLDSVVPFSRHIRALLGDRKLLSFLQGE